jgi:phosphomevalonate kinase
MESNMLASSIQIQLVFLSSLCLPFFVSDLKFKVSKMKKIIHEQGWKSQRGMMQSNWTARKNLKA